MTRPDDKELEKRIGAQIRQGRRICHMTQKTLADKLGIAYQQLQKYEHGRSRISASRLLHCAIILSKPIEFFLRDAKAYLNGKPLLCPSDNFAAQDEESDIYELGLVIHSIKDKTFRDQLIRLVKRHNRIVDNSSGEPDRTKR